MSDESPAGRTGGAGIGHARGANGGVIQGIDKQRIGDDRALLVGYRLPGFEPACQASSHEPLMTGQGATQRRPTLFSPGRPGCEGPGRQFVSKS